MRYGWVVGVMLGVVGLSMPTGYAAEDAAAKKAEAPELSAEKISQMVQDYVKQIHDEEGDFSIEDEVTGNLRMLTLQRVHPETTREGDTTYVCTDMKDVDTGDALDVDFGIAQMDGKPDVVDVRIHKVNGEIRDAGTGTGTGTSAGAAPEVPVMAQ